MWIKNALKIVWNLRKGNEMRGDYDYSVECDYNDLVTPGMLAKQAAERCIAQLGSRSVPSQKCAVVFEARIASSLLKHFFQRYAVVIFIENHLG